MPRGWIPICQTQPFRVSPFYASFYDAIWANSDKLKRNTDQFKVLNFENWLKSNDAQFFFSLLTENSMKELGESTEWSQYDFEDSWKNRQNNMNYNMGAYFHEISVKDSAIKRLDHLTLPYSILDYYYGSNGMCAGNTSEEAIIQGLCEIIERYVQRKLVLEIQSQIYDVTNYCTQLSESIPRVIEILDENEYSITLLECPTPFAAYVVVAMLKRKNQISYYLSLGCHPDIIIAAERAVDELLQGYSIGTLDDALENNFAINTDIIFTHENYMSLLKFGIGQYPVGIVVNHFPAKNNYKQQACDNNQSTLLNLIKSISNAGLRVYASKGLDLGLPAYHVIIPGISEAENILPSSKIRHDKSISPYDNLKNIKPNEAAALAKQCSVLYSAGDKYLTQLLDIDKYTIYTNARTPVNDIHSSIFIALLYMKSQNWAKAAEYTHVYYDELIAHISAESNSDIGYYKIIESILLLLETGLNEDEIAKTLSVNSYDIKSMTKLIKEGDKLFDDIPSLSKDSLIVENDDLYRVIEAEKNILYKIIRES